MKHILGIDAGSTTISIALLDENKKVIDTKYIFHKGLVKENLKKALKEMDLNEIYAIALTSSTPNILKNTISYDNQIAIIEAVKLFHKKVGSILIVGGEQFGLIKFNELGDYKSFKSNTSCAAGTGSFLDQQAVRLNLKDSKELSDIAFRSDVKPPQIATRCSVFAKTDLIHAQQEGYKLAEISDGLCKGLSKNITDTLFSDEDILEPLIFVGGVSKNMAVYKHLKEQTNVNMILHDWSHLYDAIGVAVIAIDEGKLKNNLIDKLEWIEDYKDKLYGYDELQLKYSDYPDFSSLEYIDFTPSNKKAVSVEVDLYQKLENNNNVYMGIDIGSTSTKAILVNEHRDVLAGFYTRTSGQPIIATQAIFESIEDLQKRYNTEFKILGATTTGSGRKFIGKIIGADLMIDEITAHAKAAHELDPEVDTIIEIGGQDAKFTTLKNGMVTSSIMNNVCAAGTGSFIEEQAQKLGVPLAEYSKRAEKAKAPVSSDRCTVYMERDINHYLSEGYSVDEVLSSVLHSVRENYLAKVAVEANIGSKIFFQGATARNKALVAAFEQKLQKPILVSKYCHLTGALGGALIAIESSLKQSFFKGLQLYKNNIPIENEVCTICNNNCKIKKVTVENEVVAFGFLCGRDYETKKFVAEKKIGYDLLKTYKKAMKYPSIPTHKSDLPKIGIPLSLTMSQKGKAWEYFFKKLNIPVVVTKNLENSIKTGKKVSGAEFCVPISSFHGHVKALEGKADLLFLPNYFETKDSNLEKLRQYCYYTQFSTSLIVNAKGILFNEDNILSPIIEKSDFKTKIELYQTLKKHYKISYWAISAAFDEAFMILESGQEELKKVFQREYENREDIDVVLLGRPYTVLDKNMNKGIPEIFAKNGLKTYFQEMIPYEKDELFEIEDLLKSFHWNYTAKILEVAHVVSKMEGLYPVYVSSFKCGPDSFALQYFKRIMDKANKPYLILELDEHDSSVGYETRIEAAIRAFKNHSRTKFEKLITDRSLPINPMITKNFKGKKLLFPSWDDVSASLIVALLKSTGIDAEMVPVTEKSIKQGPRNNSGQCLPINIMIESFIEYVETNNLDPKQCVAWMMDAVLACNIRLYPHLMKTSFEAHGNGFENLEVYMGEITMTDISMQISLNLYFAFMFAGMLRKLVNKVRPYEVNKGETDIVMEKSREIFYDTFLNKTNLDDAVKIVVNKFKNIKTIKTNRPKVAILGDLYVRDNDLMNQNVVRAIEDAGGEAITTPYNEYARMIAAPYMKRWVKLGYYKEAMSVKALTTLVAQLEKKYYKRFNEVLQEDKHVYSNNFKDILADYGVTLSHSGESFDNLIKIDSLSKNYPDISLFVLTNPAFCCAGAVTEAMSSKVEELTNIPVVALNYDGTGSDQNKKLIPYIKYARNKIDMNESKLNGYVVL